MTEMHISERELLAMVDDVKDAQADAMPRFHRGLAELTELTAERGRGTRASRRTVLMAGGMAFGGLALAACSGSTKSTSTGTPTATSAAPSGKYEGDFLVVALAAALENAANFAYGAGIAAANAGKLGKVPPAVVTFATTANAQHTEHGKGWNAFLMQNSLKPVLDIPLTIVPAVKDQLSKVNSVSSLAEFALGLEDIAAATYISAASGVSAQAGINVAMSIAPVEAQHVAILNFVLGKYPVPNALYDAKAAIGPDVFQQ